VSDAQLGELKQRLRAFRRELLQQAELGNTPERVVQINFQLFPMSVASHARSEVAETAVPAGETGTQVAKVARTRSHRRRG
jgi:hypothetical protein